MKVLTAEQMVHVDRATIEKGTPGIDLMRNAGKAVVEFINETIGIDRNARIIIVAGKGNNGGDGFRVAELLNKNGHEVEVYLVGKKSDISGDAKLSLHDAMNEGVSIFEMKNEKDLDVFSQGIESASLIVDALFGTGLKGDITGLPASVVELMNESSAVVVAVDIPSGVNATTGFVSEPSVCVDYTVTFGCLKVGHVCMPGRAYCGEVNIVDIGFADDIMDSIEPFAQTLIMSEAGDLIPNRPYNAHKGSVGRVVVVSGSVGMTGASTLTSLSAMRVGAGVVTIACPESINDILEVKVTEVMTFPLPEVRKKRCLSLRALGLLREVAKKADVVAIGPGLGTYCETSELVRRFVAEYHGRVILDADGINAFKGKSDILKHAPCKMVLTPHAGELSRLLSIPIENITANPFVSVKNAAEATGKIVCLKGVPTVIAEPNGHVWINSTGNKGMATAGMGDILTGIIAGLSAQGLSLFHSAILGSYIHGFAGEIASENKGIHGVISGDVLELIPTVMMDIIDETCNEKG